MKQYDESLYSMGQNDECYTPVYGVLPIIKYLPKDKTIWCPFDTDDCVFLILVDCFKALNPNKS